MQREGQCVVPSFPADVSVVQSAGQSEILFDASAELPESVGAVVRVVRAFLAAAKVGMFSTEPRLGQVGIEPVAADRVSERQVRYRWRVGGIQPGAFRVLFNMLEVTHHLDGPLGAVSLRSTTGYGGRLNLDGIVKGAFPLRSAHAPFPVVQRQSLESSRDPLVRLVFESKIDDHAIEALAPLFAVWDEVVILGGYLTSLEDRDADVNVDESLRGAQTYLAAPDTAEHLFYEFVGAAAAYDAFLNMAVRIHYSFRPLSSFEVE